MFDDDLCFSQRIEDLTVQKLIAETGIETLDVTVLHYAGIAQDYASQGIRATIEMCLKGKQCDVGVMKNGIMNAIEVALRPDNEPRNVLANLHQAGFEKVVVACKNTKVRQSVQKRLKAVLSPQDAKRVQVILLSDLPFAKKLRRSMNG